MTPTMIRIRDVNEFMRAVSVKERILACLSAFIKRALPQSGIGSRAGRNGRQGSNDEKCIRGVPDTWTIQIWNPEMRSRWSIRADKGLWNAICYMKTGDPVGGSRTGG